MKISNSTPNYINQAYNNPANAAGSQNLKSKSAAEETQTDSINLSGRTRDLQKISKTLETEPADRKTYVAEIKDRIRNNQYNVNAEKIADKMVGSLMNEIG